MIASRRECSLGILPDRLPNRRCAARHETVIEKEINSSPVPSYVDSLPLDFDRGTGGGGRGGNRVFIREADYSVNGERGRVFRARLAENDYRLCRHSFCSGISSVRIDFRACLFIFARPRMDMGDRRRGTRRDATRRGSRSAGQKSFPFRPAQNAGHRNVVLPVHAVARREASKSPG